MLILRTAHKAYLVYKKLFNMSIKSFICVTFFFFCNKSLYAQQSSFTGLVDRALILNIKVPENVIYDSCYYSSTLLKLEVNKFSKIVSIEFSDNAEEWLKMELARLKREGKINFMKFDSLAKKEKLKDCKLLFPVIINALYPCQINDIQPICEYDYKYFQFNGKYIQGNVKFGDRVGYSFNKPVS